MNFMEVKVKKKKKNPFHLGPTQISIACMPQWPMPQPLRSPYWLEPISSIQSSPLKSNEASKITAWLDSTIRSKDYNLTSPANHQTGLRARSREDIYKYLVPYHSKTRFIFPLFSKGHEIQRRRCLLLQSLLPWRRRRRTQNPQNPNPKIPAFPHVSVSVVPFRILKNRPAISSRERWDRVGFLGLVFGRGNRVARPCRSM